MTPIKIITSVEEGIGFFKVKEKMLTEAGLTCLPVLDRQGILKGIYFRKDCRPAQPAYHNNKPLVGMAISVKQNDLERAEDAMKIGVGKIVIDSSHGDCPAVIEQAKRLVSLRDKLDCQTAIIAGNVGSIDGYLRLAEAGVDAVKVGIGSGSICTTSLATGVGVPMFSLIRECFYAKKYLRQHNKKHAPLIIADGGINFTGQIVLALAAGASLCMGGQYFVAAQESKGAIEKNCKEGDLIPYRGMASLEAIKARLSARYGEQKRAAEGVSGFEPCRGPLKKWIGNDSELIAGGFSHVGAGNIEELHKICDSDPYIFSLITSAGQQQMQTRVIME